MQPSDWPWHAWTSSWWQGGSLVDTHVLHVGKLGEIATREPGNLMQPAECLLKVQLNVVRAAAGSKQAHVTPVGNCASGWRQAKLQRVGLARLLVGFPVSWPFNLPQAAGIRPGRRFQMKQGLE